MPWTRIESGAYWLVFAAAFLAVAIWESFRPRGSLSVKPERRWGRHAVILLACTMFSAGLLRITPVLTAVAVTGSRFGLLNKPWLPLALRFAIAVLLLDFVKYATHRCYHSVYWLWRVHQVHHSDPDFDVSTGIRAHPIEILLTQGAYLAAIAAFAPPPVAVLAAELIGCLQSFFGHANASLPPWAEKRLRRVFVTPDLHRIHHSEEIGEQSKNLGEIFPWWDRLFGTYLEAPAAGEKGMITGLKGFQNERSVNLGFMLMQPFRPEARARAASVDGL